MVPSYPAAIFPDGTEATTAGRVTVPDDAALARAAQSGDHAAFAPLVDRWFDRCWEIAWRILHDRDLAADVAQDTLLVAWRRLDGLERPESFGGWVLRIARNRALDRLARERRTRPTDDDADLEPAVRAHDASGPEGEATRAAQRDLVWAAAAALGERDASLLDLHLRHGLEPAELADALGIAPNAAHQAMFRLRQRLGDAIRAWLLWRHADPACVVLRAELAAAGHEAFDATTVRLIRRHVKTCDDCTDEQRRVAAPAALFSVVPLVMAPTAARADALRALGEAGVPVPPDDGPNAGPDEESSAPPATRPDVRDGATTTRRAQLRSAVGPVHLVVLAFVCGVLVSAGGLAWSRSRGAPVTVVSEVPAPAAVVPAETMTPDQPADTGRTRRRPRRTRTPDQPAGTPVSPPEPAEPALPPAPEPERTRPPRPADPEPTAPPVEEPSPPEILAFRIAHVGVCARSQMPQFELSWATEGGDSVTLSGPDGTETATPAGVGVHCAQDGAVFTLTVSGPGGSTSRSATADAPEPLQ